MTHCYLGIDIGGTKIAAGLVTAGGRVMERGLCPTPAREGGPAVLGAALALAKAITEGVDGIAGMGIGAGGQIDAQNGVVLFATDVLPRWSGTRIKEEFVAQFGPDMPVSVDNDVNALALGELRFGAAQGLRTVAFLALGTGVGGALCIDGVLHHGAHWSGAEFGHLIIDITAGARIDAGGRSGMLEAYASGPGLVQTWREITGDDDPAVTGRIIAEDALRDPGGAGRAAVTRTGEYLGYGLASLANVLDPDLFVIGGGLASLGDLLLDPARRVLRDRGLPGPATCPVVTATLGEDASVIGAACLAMDRR